MIVSGAMLAAGLTLRRLREDAEQARPTIEARLCLGSQLMRLACRINDRRCAPRRCPRSIRPRSSD
jgi:putative ABC transport system permease protein